jgi:hypothetical protein
MSAFIALFVTMMDRDRPPVRPTSPREDALSLTMHAIAFGGVVIYTAVMLILGML